jgi:hypothetical protein
MTPVPAPEKTLEQMLDELESLRDRKAEIEKKEAELVKAIQRRSEKQADRMNRLGVGGAVVPVAPQAIPLVEVPQVPDRVGRVVIEGNAGKDEKKIRDLVKIVPGEVLNYPALEAARTRLGNAGYPSVEVAVRDGEGNFKDVVVRFSGPNR